MDDPTRFQFSTSILRLFYETTAYNLVPIASNKPITWSAPAKFALMYVVVSLALLFFIILELPKAIGWSYEWCAPDAHFGRLGVPGFGTLFSQFSLVAVTIPLGRFNFLTAKLIDIGWDVIISRLGQVIIGLVSYLVFMRTFLHSMRTTPVPHGLLSTLVFSGPYSPSTLYALATLDQRSELWHRSRGRLAVIFLTVLYLVIFPTLSSAMTGYTTNFLPVMKLNQNFYPFPFDSDSGCSQISFIVHNGAAIGLSGTIHTTKEDIVEAGITFSEYDPMTERTLEEELNRQLQCEKVSSNKSCSTFVWPDGTTIDLRGRFLNIEPVIKQTNWACAGQVLDDAYVDEFGTCQPTDDYQWGFSFQLVFILALANLLWSLAMLCLWISSADVRSCYGPYRAAVDLVKVAREATDEPLEMLTDTEIRSKLDAHRAGLVIGRSEWGLLLTAMWDCRLPFRKETTTRTTSMVPRWIKSVRSPLQWFSESKSQGPAEPYIELHHNSSSPDLQGIPTPDPLAVNVLSARRAEDGTTQLIRSCESSTSRQFS